MQSFALVALLSALFMTGVTAGPYKRWALYKKPYNTSFWCLFCIETLRDQPNDANSPVLFTFSDAPSSAFPSGTDVPHPKPTGAHGSGGQIYICHPIDPSAVPPPTSALTSSPAPTSTILAPMGDVPAPGDGQGSSPTYICYPADPANVPAPNPSGPAPTSNAPNPSVPTSSTDNPNPAPTESKPPGGPSYICHPADPAGTPKDKPAPSSPAPTITPTP